MKLFQRLLVAPAALGLISPIAANATEVNLNEISNYSEVESIEFANSFDSDQPNKSLLIAGGEGLGDSSSFDESFSSTTTASFSADFAIGAVDGKGITSTDTDGDETLQAIYGFQIDLNTSFTGEDSLDISIDAGNATVATSGANAGSQTGPLAEFDLNGGGDGLVVDGISYTFPLGDKTTVIVGDNTDGSALFNIACVYGGPSNTLDDCGTVMAGITGGGVALGASYDIGGGVTAAFGYQGVESGIGTLGNKDQYAFNVAYTADNYGISYTYAAYENHSAAANNHTDSYNAFNGYYTLDNGLSISAGYEVGALQNATSDEADETQSYFVGLDTEVGPGTLGVAYGTYGTMTEAANVIPDRMMYEAYYSYEVNDGMTITPLLYTVEGSSATDEDETGIMVKTSFSF